MSCRFSRIYKIRKVKDIPMHIGFYLDDEFALEYYTHCHKIYTQENENGIYDDKIKLCEEKIKNIIEGDINASRTNIDRY